MNVVCLDMEGVIYPEIWIAFSEESGIPELRRTTREEPDYDKLMKWRIGLLKERGLKLKDVQNTIDRKSTGRERVPRRAPQHNAGDNSQ